jgi:hypothetical protein
MRNFPFPDKELSKDELSRDLLYEKIPVEDRDKLIEKAWEIGVSEARKYVALYPDKDIYYIAKSVNLNVAKEDIDRINGKMRYFSEYTSLDNKITIYKGSIKKWAKSNKCTYEEAEEIILAHEFFHFLECKHIGEVSKIYQVATLKIGKKVLLKSGIKALSEIAAHGFAYEYYSNR